MSTSQPLPNTLSLPFVESLYAEYLENPDAVDVDWRRYFDQLNPGQERPASLRIGPSFRPASLFHSAPPYGDNGSNGSNGLHGVDKEARQQRDQRVALLQDKVDQLLRAFRTFGHLNARINPLGFERPPRTELDPDHYGLTERDLDRTFSTESVPNAQTLKLRDLLERMRNTYCRSIGVQFMHIDDPSVKQWLIDRMETTENRITLTVREQIRILTRLTDAVVFEEFLQRKFIGSKSFSLEGAETLIPLLETAIDRAGESGVEQIVLGMAHRGRLNVLANILGKRPKKIFREFADLDPENYRGRGDVKYHLGYSNDWTTSTGKKVHLSLCFNPSHLEFVNTVALGRVRALQDKMGDEERQRGLCILIHGDAAFAGEGMTQETLNLSELHGYRTGGSIHVIVNNQIGFTTSPHESGSITYCTDAAKVLQIPIFHV
ncbi:MAG: thiamine pyrophosphate-dependent enzyme, partial [Planctomycetia bacterium]